jgi:hypothetical protein
VFVCWFSVQKLPSIQLKFVEIQGRSSSCGLRVDVGVFPRCLPGVCPGVRALRAGPPCILNPTFCIFAVLSPCQRGQFRVVTQPPVNEQLDGPGEMALYQVLSTNVSSILFLRSGAIRDAIFRRVARGRLDGFGFVLIKTQVW